MPEIPIPTKVVIDTSVYNQFFLYTKLYGETEWGGVLVGYQENNVFYGRTAVLPPPHKTQSGVYCEFKKEIFPLITQNLRYPTLKPHVFPQYSVGAWIHTHPGLSVFFSATDISMFEYLTKLSHTFLAIVLDPINDQLLALNGQKGEKYGFTEIEIELDNELAPFIEEEREILQEFQQRMESTETAKKLGVDSCIRTFIPLSEQELSLKTMQIRLEYCETKLAKLHIRPTLTIPMGGIESQLAPYIEPLGLKGRKVIIPQSCNILEDGFLFTIRENGGLKSQYLYWKDYKAAKLLIYTSQLILLVLIPRFFRFRKKKHFLLYTTVSLESLYKCIKEYLPQTELKSSSIPDKAKKAPEPREEQTVEKDTEQNIQQDETTTHLEHSANYELEHEEVDKTPSASESKN